MQNKSTTTSNNKNQKKQKNNLNVILNFSKPYKTNKILLYNQK